MILSVDRNNRQQWQLTGGGFQQGLWIQWWDSGDNSVSTLYVLLGGLNGQKRWGEGGLVAEGSSHVAGGARLRQFLVETGGISGSWKIDSRKVDLHGLCGDRRSVENEEEWVAVGGIKWEKRCRGKERERKKNGWNEFQVLNVEYIAFNKLLKKKIGFKF